MKSKFLLAAGLFVTALGYSQNTTYYATSPSVAGSGGNNSVHVGDQAGISSTSNDQVNVFIGYRSGQNHTGSLEQDDANVFIGNYSGYGNTTGIKNVMIGNRAGFASSTNNFNVMIGSSAGYNNTEGYNVMLGASAGFNNNEKNNVFIGYWSGANNYSGKNNVFIGHYSGYSETGSNVFCLQNSSGNKPLIIGKFEIGAEPNVQSESELKFNARKVGIGFDSNGEFGSFANTSTWETSGFAYRFFVRGGILAEEVRIRTQANWPDYVFASDYNLMPLTQVEEYISENGHLPNMPSAAEVEKEGIALGSIVKLQQEKIEELTLHLIEQNKKIEALEKQNAKLEELKAKVEQLLNK